MTREEVRTLLAQLLPEAPVRFEPPSPEAWKALEMRFETEFPDEFVYFIDLMGEYDFPGAIYSVSDEGRTTFDAPIGFVYDQEVELFRWPPQFVPFYGIGNGDYFALNREEGRASRVYYRDHEDESMSEYSPSFAAWLEQLGDFLGAPGTTRGSV
ncbi:MAG: SMI1/KNR4 family protein [Polyangiaceae bacterium]|nr:SMI1/KNR4 family protein [Polyangiaceae bacterium]